MAMPGFIFGGSEPMTYEQLQRQREIADALLAQNMRAPATFGEGLVTVGRAIAAKRKNKKADAREGELRDEFNSRFNSAFGGGSGFGSGGGSYGGGSYTPPPPRSQWNQGTDISAPDVAALGARTEWNGGAVDAMQPNMFSTFGQEAPGGGKSGYNMGTDAVANTPDAAFRAELLAGGLPPHVVDGIMMNAHDESAFNPTAVGDNGAAFGLLQWNGPRKQALQQWSAANGLDPADPRTQAKFTVYELQGPEANAGRALMSTSTPGEAGAAFVNLYERPAEQHRASREAKYLGGGGFAPQGGGEYGATSAAVDPSMFGRISDAAAQPQPAIANLTGGFGLPAMGGGGGGLTGGFDIATLTALASDPMASPEQKAILDMLLKQQTQAMDPMYQMQLEEQRLKLAQMQGGGQPEALAEREAMARAGGLQPNTPEWNTYMLTGDLPKGGARPLTPEERAMWGIDPNDKTPYAMGENGIPKAITAGGTNVTVDLGSDESELKKALGKKEGEIWAGYIEAGSTAVAAEQDMAALDELITIAPQGPITGRLAEMFPGFSTAGDTFQSIVKRVAPTLRAPGSGSTSDIEYDGMLKSLPKLSNRPEANAAIAGLMKAKAALNKERAAIVAAYQNGDFDDAEARRKMAELDKRSIMTPEIRAALGIEGAASGGPIVTDDGYTIEVVE